MRDGCLASWYNGSMLARCLASWDGDGMNFGREIFRTVLSV